MRRGEAEPEYQWFHYHLNNAVRHMPGAKAKQRLFRCVAIETNSGGFEKNEKNRSECFDRGQPNRYGVEYKPGETIVVSTHG